MNITDAVSLAVELAAEYKSLSSNSSIESSMIDENEIIFDQLYEDYPVEISRAISRNERTKRRYKSPSLTYGEITFQPFKHVLESLYHYGYPSTGGVFLDIGCGTGRPVFAAALLHEFSLCVGIEILEDLHNACKEVQMKWTKLARQKLPKKKQELDIRFYYGDATAMDWHNPDIVFANSTCFSKGLQERIARKAEKLRPGTFFITTTTMLPSSEYELLYTTIMEETWGDATVFVQRKMMHAASNVNTRPHTTAVVTDN